jgi:hypothetical protein
MRKAKTPQSIAADLVTRHIRAALTDRDSPLLNSIFADAQFDLIVAAIAKKEGTSVPGLTDDKVSFFHQDAPFLVVDELGRLCGSARTA